MNKILIFIILWSLIFSVSLYGQTQDIVKAGKTVSPLHRSNMGKIVFTAKPVPSSELKETDLLKNYKLTNRSDLFFTVFMDNSITNYMHRMAPGLEADSLVKIGNYQFSFYVDDRLIHQSNLLPGAPLAKTQDTATTISKPLIDNENEGVWWSQFLWGRFMHHGGDSALTDGRHLLKIEIRPYLRLDTVKTGKLIASGKLNVDVDRDPEIDIENIRLNTLKPYDGFTVSKEHFNRDKIKELIGNIHENVFKKISSVVVIKNGELLIEEYFNDESRSTLHDPRSVGKSFASTITGIAINEGYLKSEHQTLKDFYNLRSFANYTPQKGNISLKDLLTMSSDFDGDDSDFNSPGNEENMYPTSDWVKFTLDLPLNTDRSKEEWHYFTAGVVLLGNILDKQVKGGLEDYADAKLFQPLGIAKYKWEYTPQHVPNTAGGIRMNALDFAKYGQLHANEGKWNGKQIIPKEWVHKSLTKQKEIPHRENEFYGYLFWNRSFNIKGKTYEAFYCAGNGGNYIFIFQDQPLVVVITATAYNQPYAHPQVDKMMTGYILPAVVK